MAQGALFCWSGQAGEKGNSSRGGEAVGLRGCGLEGQWD